MVRFLGEYEVTLDAKGRFLLPSGFKKQLPEAELRFIVNRGFEKCLTLYPANSWEPIHAKISELNDFDPKVRAFRRQFLGGATEVEADSAGRLLLPPTLRDFAGLTKNVILVAAVDKIEIWDADTYKKIFEEFSPEAFSNLAKEVMVKPDATNE
ncbi:MAG TPA: division/cell wall cluster transcriptional repressor MraZ [Arachidicoccus soli]|uniref:Transcriptional regulator MraZ n=1 Tax=Arachidicoccus soli TaxID=2341117 RepID=A0A386HTU2_9BACT|nr:division/cell wall cluster transcriptional repressor MraZ [Arachidicoccus soli]AYD48840.1 division/cell wall cluster transcriptional repressor MraZ [Arachidicoccus soli]HEU0227608.1 division/cell wall cluster transcriptional repressor MraZ [Arachidicoccus soli]